MKVCTNITYEHLARATLVLMGEGMDKDDALEVLQAIGYTLLDTELFPEDDETFDEDELSEMIEDLRPQILGGNNDDED